LSTEDEKLLIEKLRKIEALFARPGTAGERAAAGRARDRIRERLRLMEKVEAPVAHRFSIRDPWSYRLFTALLLKHGLRPYRHPGQRRTTVMVRVTRTFVEKTLWPQFRTADRILRQNLNEVTQRIIAKAFSGDLTDRRERPPGNSSPRKGQPEQRVMDLG
jgi:hypothetical protein